MAYSLNGSTQYFSSAPPFHGGSSLTASVRVKFTSLAADGKIFCVWEEVGGNYEWLLGSTTTPNLYFYCRFGGDFPNVIAGSITTGSWYHVVGRYDGTTLELFMDGTSLGTASHAGPITTTTGNLSMGAGLNGSSPDVPLNGEIAEASIWDAALTNAEIAALAKGRSALGVRPQSLRFYAPLVRDTKELKAATSITSFASPSAAAHPRVYGL